MREISLFTGHGGGLLGSLILGWEPVQFVEHDEFCQRGLAGRFPDVPCHSDVRDFHPVPGSCDIVTGGFPCQPFSQAGKRLGEDDPRNMWPHAVRVLVESGAPLGFFENVPGLLSSGYFGTVLGDLAEAGFDAEWCVLGADDVGAPHRRKRLWILAYRHGAIGTARLPESKSTGERRGRSWSSGSPWRIDPADWCPINERLCEWRSRCDLASRVSPYPGATGEWKSFAPLGRVASGVGSRVDRLRVLGNGQVPQTMAAAWTYLAREAGILDT